MKQKITLLFFLFFTIVNYSQNDNENIIYYDSIWKKTTKENHSYYRIVKELPIKSLYLIEYYYKSGSIQMEAISTIKDTVFAIGEQNYYYENGNKRLTQHWNKSLFGKFEEWYENGSKKEEGEYIETYEYVDSDKYKLHQYWDPKGNQTVINGNGFYESFDKKNNESGNIKSGFKHGLWKGKNLKGNILNYEETYKKGVLVSGISTDVENIEHKYDVLESKPVPRGGIGNFYEYISSHYTKPSEFYSIRGTIYIRFCVQEDGKIVEPKILKSLHPVLDQEAIRVITNYPKWIPGNRRGVNCKALYRIPVSL